MSVVQTFGDRANFHPHVHALATRGGRTSSGEWVPVPYVDEGAAEELFRHKVLRLLRRRGLVSEERIELLLSWRRSGFSVHNRVFAHPGAGRDFEALVRYMSKWGAHHYIICGERSVMGSGAASAPPNVLKR